MPAICQGFKASGCFPKSFCMIRACSFGDSCLDVIGVVFVVYVVGVIGVVFVVYVV